MKFIYVSYIPCTNSVRVILYNILNNLCMKQILCILSHQKVNMSLSQPPVWTVCDYLTSPSFLTLNLYGVRHCRELAIGMFSLHTCHFITFCMCSCVVEYGCAQKRLLLMGMENVFFSRGDPE